MRKLTRRLTAVVLSACLALAPLGAFAQTPQGLTALVVLPPMQDGAQMTLPVQAMITSSGETVYWLDMSALDEAQLEALSMGELILYDEAGELWGQYALNGTEAAAEGDGLFELYDAIDPGMSVPLMLAPMAMPESPEEAEAVLVEYGFTGGGYGDFEDVPEYTEDAPEYTEDVPEYTEDAPEYTEDVPEYTEDVPEYTEDVPECTEDAPEYTEDVPEYAEDVPEYTEDVPEFTEDVSGEIDEPEVIMPEMPEYATPIEDGTDLRSEPAIMDGNVIALVGASDMLTVFDYVVDNENRVWWQAEDIRTGVSGYIMADATAAADETAYYTFLERLEAEQPEINEPEIDEPEINEPEINEPVIDEPEINEPEINEPEIDEPEIDEPVINEPEINKPEINEPEINEPEINEPEIGEPVIDEPEINEPVIDEPEIDEPTDQEPAVHYAVTSNKNNPTNNLRASADSKADVVGTYENGELVTFGEPTEDGKWYPVTVVRDGAQGYMRDYLLTEISDADAQARMAEILADKALEPETNEPEIDEPEVNESEINEPETSEPGTGDPEINEPETSEPGTGDPEINEPETNEPGTDEPEISEPEVNEPDDAEEENGEDEPSNVPAQAFPAYVMTLPQDNAVIVLRTQAGGELPQNGAVPMIREPTPLEVSDAQTAADGQVWYYVRNMNTGETGYIEAYKVEEVTREAAEAAVKDVTDVIPPVPSDNPTGDTEDQEETGGDQTGDEEPGTTEPDIPQELTDGDIYHYGRNTGRQVGLRKAPGGDRIYNMEAGTIIWVMSRDGDWCHVRTDRAEGYMMAEFVELMGVNEEAAYRASIDDPEIAPEQTPAPEETDPVEEITPAPEETDPVEEITPAPEETDPVEEITPAPEETDPVEEITPAPEETDLVELITPVPEETQTPQPTATPAPEQIDRYAVVMENNTQMHASADSGAYLQAVLAGNDVVYAMHSEMNAAGETWTLLQADGQWGYVLSDHLRVMSEQEQADYLAAQEAANATPIPTAEPTATPEPTTTPAPQRLDLYARVINDGTPLRGNPDPNAYLQSILSEETVVYLFQSQLAEDGMMWYLVQYAGQWGFVRADLVRPMGEQETKDYLAQLEAELATPTPMPQATPEPIGPDSTSAYAKLVKDKVNLRRTPSASGTSLGRVPVNTLLLVLGSEYDGTYTWYQVNYNGTDGYIRSDMAQMLTISELTEYYREQMEQAQATGKPGVSTTPNKNNNTSVVIGGSQLKDLLPVDDSWTNNVISGMPVYATATPDPNATPTPVPPAKAAALIRTSGDITVSNVPALTDSGTFSVYGRAKALSVITATVETTVNTGAAAAPATIGQGLVSAAIAESVQTVKRTVGQAVADAEGRFAMDVTLPQPGEYIVEFASADGAFAQYGVTYDTGATPEPTAQPLPTAMPVQEEDGGMGILPFVIGGLLIVVAAAVYGVYVYRRRTEEEEEEEDEDDETGMREEQLNMQRQRRAETPASAPRTTSTVIPGAQRTPQSPKGAANAQVPSYMKNTEKRPPVSPYARPAEPTAPTAPKAPVAPTAPKAPVAPTAPKAPVAPTAPKAPVVPTAPKAPVAPVAPVAPAEPKAPSETAQSDAEPPRRRRRPPVDPNA